MGEANFPTKSAQTVQEARVPPPDVDPGGPGHPEGPSPQGPPSPVRLVGRVRDRATFAAFRASRARARRGPLTVTWVPGARYEPPRVAYAIGRSAGGAVDRNRLRRRLRAIVSELSPELRAGAYLVGAGRSALELSHQELKAMVSHVLSELPEVPAR